MAEQGRFPFGKGTISWTRDYALNDSDKSFTVPTGKIWKPLMIQIDFTASGTVGNRVIAVNIAYNGTNYEGYFAGGSVAASAHVWYVIGFQGITDDLTTAARTIAQGVPEIYLPAGAIIRVYDSAAIDVNADDLGIVFHYIEYDA